MNTFEPIKASVDASFLDKVDRIFDATPRTVFNELIQNARRAGATMVSLNLKVVKEEEVEVRFSDNGSGIPDPSILLRLAKSEWNASTKKHEDPAGMGFFCLSNFEHVLVTSLNWNVLFTPEVFRGAQAVTPTEIAPTSKETVIHWVWKGETADVLIHAFRCAVKHSGLGSATIKLNDKKLEPCQIVPFLHASEQITVFEDAGYTIGIHDHNPDAMRCHTVSINFHGVEIQDKLELFGFIDFHSYQLNVRVDVQSSSGLRLVLPARNALKQDGAYKKLQRHIMETLLNWVSTKQHSFRYKHYLKALNSWKIDIGHATPNLNRWQHSHEDEEGKIPDRALIMPSKLGSDQQLWQIVDAFNTLDPKTRPVLMHGCPDFEGYPWYDRVEQIQDAFCAIDTQLLRIEDVSALSQDYAHEVDGAPQPIFYRKNSSVFKFVDSIEFIIKTDGGQEFRFMRPFVMGGEEINSWFGNIGCNEVMCLIARPAEGERVDTDTIQDVFVDRFFEASDDWEANSAEQQQEEFEKDLMEELLEVVGSPFESVRYVLEQAIEGLPCSLRSPKLKWAIRSFGNRPISDDCDYTTPYRRITGLTIDGEGLKEYLVTDLTSGALPTSYLVSSMTPVTAERVRAWLKLAPHDEVRIQPLEGEMVVDLDEIENPTTKS